MRTDAIIPISPEVAEQLEQARLTSAFDALYEAGGVVACAHMVTALLERLEARIRADVANGAGRAAP